MRELHNSEIGQVAGAGGLALGVGAAANVSLRPLAKINAAVAIGVSLKGSNHKHC